MHKLCLLAAAVAAAAVNAGASAAPHATAVTKKFSITMNELETEEHRYVDGMAVRFAGGAAAVLTRAPLDACTRQMVAARNSSDFGSLGTLEEPVLVLIRDEEHADGAVLAVSQYMKETLEDKLPGFATDGASLVFRADLGDAGWGSIDATKYGGRNAPHVAVDIDLPWTTVPASDPAADGSAEGEWLRDLKKQVEGASDASGVLAAAGAFREDDYFSERELFDILANWKNLKVDGIVRDKDCAVLAIAATTFSGTPGQAFFETRMVDGTRQVTRVVVSGDD